MVIYSVLPTENQSSEQRFRKFLSLKMESASKAERESDELAIIKRFFRAWREVPWIIRRGFRLWKEALENSKDCNRGCLVNVHEWLQEGLNYAQAVYLSVFFQIIQELWTCTMADLVAEFAHMFWSICFESAGIWQWWPLAWSAERPSSLFCLIWAHMEPYYNIIDCFTSASMPIFTIGFGSSLPTGLDRAGRGKQGGACRAGGHCELVVGSDGWVSHQWVG